MVFGTSEVFLILAVIVIAVVVMLIVIFSAKVPGRREGNNNTLR